MLRDFPTDACQILCSTILRGNWNLNVILFVGHSGGWGFQRNKYWLYGSEIYASQKINLQQNIKWIYNDIDNIF